MRFEEAKIFAQQGIKMTHKDYTPDEYMIMKGNIIVFEDSVQIFADDYIKNSWLLNDWDIYIDKSDLNIGKETIEYCKQYENTEMYNHIIKAIEFGYHLNK